MPISFPGIPDEVLHPERQVPVAPPPEPIAEPIGTVTPAASVPSGTPPVIEVTDPTVPTMDQRNTLVQRHMVDVSTEMAKMEYEPLGAMRDSIIRKEAEDRADLEILRTHLGRQDQQATKSSLADPKFDDNPDAQFNPEDKSIEPTAGPIEGAINLIGAPAVVGAKTAGVFAKGVLPGLFSRAFAKQIAREVPGAAIAETVFSGIGDIKGLQKYKAEHPIIGTVTEVTADVIFTHQLTKNFNAIINRPNVLGGIKSGQEGPTPSATTYSDGPAVSWGSEAPATSNIKASDIPTAVVNGDLSDPRAMSLAIGIRDNIVQQPIITTAERATAEFLDRTINTPLIAAPEIDAIPLSMGARFPVGHDEVSAHIADLNRQIEIAKVQVPEPPPVRTIPDGVEAVPADQLPQYTAEFLARKRLADAEMATANARQIAFDNASVLKLQGLLNQHAGALTSTEVPKLVNYSTVFTHPMSDGSIAAVSKGSQEVPASLDNGINSATKEGEVLRLAELQRRMPQISASEQKQIASNATAWRVLAAYKWVEHRLTVLNSDWQKLLVPTRVINVTGALKASGPREGLEPWSDFDGWGLSHADTIELAQRLGHDPSKYDLQFKQGHSDLAVWNKNGPSDSYPDYSSPYSDGQRTLLLAPRQSSGVVFRGPDGTKSAGSNDIVRIDDPTKRNIELGSQDSQGFSTRDGKVLNRDASGKAIPSNPYYDDDPEYTSALNFLSNKKTGVFPDGSYYADPRYASGKPSKIAHLGARSLYVLRKLDNEIVRLANTPFYSDALRFRMSLVGQLTGNREVSKELTQLNERYKLTRAQEALVLEDVKQYHAETYAEFGNPYGEPVPQNRADAGSLNFVDNAESAGNDVVFNRVVDENTMHFGPDTLGITHLPGIDEEVDRLLIDTAERDALIGERLGVALDDQASVQVELGQSETDAIANEVIRQLGGHPISREFVFKDPTGAIRFNPIAINSVADLLAASKDHALLLKQHPDTVVDILGARERLQTAVGVTDITELRGPRPGRPKVQGDLPLLDIISDEGAYNALHAIDALDRQSLELSRLITDPNTSTLFGKIAFTKISILDRLYTNTFTEELSAEQISVLETKLKDLDLSFPINANTLDFTVANKAFLEKLNGIVSRNYLDFGDGTTVSLAEVRAALANNLSDSDAIKFLSSAYDEQIALEIEGSQMSNPELGVIEYKRKTAWAIKDDIQKRLRKVCP